MTEERITETRTPSGDTHTTQTVITDEKRGGSGWVIALIAVLAIGVAVWFFSQQSQSEIARDNAVAGAAGEIGAAAGEVGDAAQRAADSVGSEE
ncbi:hypothetical protein A9995_12510 [Erythrobacter sp. QSSC1-22B]|uniref:hypothetical protein n=1 Tax=Erythrobacter sp. QSSC1-22B TaxID=1860125 RepID=UPI000804861F|nr:hypothetical protein [Erythrobacter sp. QSSC1-22B]OBX18298.1 hypothetical protein A9995_12510 [Erythrobacter sp. QSSC1-22B]